MPKIRDVRRLKIVEQIIVVLLLAVIVPTVVSAIIINNINQHSVRAELQYSAMSICESIASNIETFSKSGDDELNQIVLSLKHIKSDYAREVYIKDLLINSDLILNLELVNKSDKDRYLEWKDYSTINRKKGTIEVLKKLNDDRLLLQLLMIKFLKIRFLIFIEMMIDKFIFWVVRIIWLRHIITMKKNLKT